MHVCFIILICTTSSVNPDKSSYFCSKRFKVIYFITYYKLVNKHLEHKSGNISETHKDRGKVTMEGL